MTLTQGIEEYLEQTAYDGAPPFRVSHEARAHASRLRHEAWMRSQGLID